MFLVAVATEKEINPIQQFLTSAENLSFLVTGVGPIATAASLSSYLAMHGSGLHGVLNIGVGGAYVGSGLDLLDICLAREEVFGDFGVCQEGEILDFETGLSDLNSPLFFDHEFASICKKVLDFKDISYKESVFVTVNCCSGTEKRGVYLSDKFNAGCENMEGAAVAMVCNKFSIPCFEMRSISNMVENRNPENWKLTEAIEKICQVTKIVLENLMSESQDLSEES